jgi:hypothetical protein
LEEPEAIMELFVQLDETYELGLVEDRIFISRILPVVSGSLLVFLGNCLREGNNWKKCRTMLLKEYFPLFVCGKLIREMIVFNFHKEEQPLRQYIDQIFRAYLHPSIFAYTALLDRPRFLKDLYRMVGLIKERMWVARERDRTEKSVCLSGSAKLGSPGAGCVSPVKSGAATSRAGKEVSRRNWGKNARGFWRKEKRGVRRRGELSG